MKAISTIQKIEHFQDTMQITLKTKTIKDIKENDVIEVEFNTKYRTMSQNAYLWVLCTKIAQAFAGTKDSVYETLLKRYGQQFVVRIQKDKDTTTRFFKIVKYYEKLDETESTIDYRVFVGSSEYTREEMMQLIDGAISECEELGIDHLTPDQIRKMKTH